MIVSNAVRLLNIERGKDYRPVWVNESPRLRGDAAAAATGAGHWDPQPIFKFWVAKNTIANTFFVRVWAYDHKIGDSPDPEDYVDIPVVGFVLGQEYSIYFRKYIIVNGAGEEQDIDDDDFVLIGYIPKNFPYELD